MKNLDLDDLLASVGGHVRPREDEGHRIEIINRIIAADLLQPGLTLVDIFESVWPDETALEISVRLSSAPLEDMAIDVRAWLLGEGWFYLDTPDGHRRWFSPEFDPRPWLGTVDVPEGDENDGDE